MNVTRMKKTGKIVYEMGKCDNNHTSVLFPFGRKTRKGKLGVCQPVRNENLKNEKQEPGFVG